MEISKSSTDTLRYQFANYVHAYRTVNNTDDLLTPVARDGDIPAYEATDAAWAAFDALDDDLAPRTMRRVHEAVDSWYAHLVRRKRAAVNPVAGLEDEYRWSHHIDATGDARANPELDASHVQALYDAATTRPTASSWHYVRGSSDLVKWLDCIVPNSCSSLPRPKCPLCRLRGTEEWTEPGLDPLRAGSSD